MIKVKQLSKTYGAVSALSGVSFALPDHGICALVGESGSGKSTVLKLIAGLERPTNGEVHLADRCLSSSSIQLPPERRSVGLVFQDFALFPHLTVEKNVRFGWKNSSARSVQEWIDLVQLNGHERKYPHQLSGGQMQRVALARTLASEPDFLLLDEPFSNLDQSLKSHMRRELRQILEPTGTPALFVTHDMEDALSIADHMLILHDGELVQQGKPEAVYRDPVNAYVASLFGEVNASTGGIFLRPEHIRLDQEGNEARVVSSTFFGSFYKVRLVCSKRGELLVHHNAALTAGDLVYYTLKKTEDEPS